MSFLPFLFFLFNLFWVVFNPFFYPLPAAVLAFLLKKFYAFLTVMIKTILALSSFSKTFNGLYFFTMTTFFIIHIAPHFEQI